MCYLANDPLVERLCGLSRLPSWHTLWRWLRGFDPGGVQALLEEGGRLVAEVIEHSRLRRLTLDVDGSVVSAGRHVEGARRGFNPHRRKVPFWRWLGLQECIARRRTLERVDDPMECCDQWLWVPA